jgi:anti-sigma factor RsiW
MNNSPHSNDDRPELEQQLVGYLDGELDGQQTRLVEEALAADPHVREEVWQLERSWQLLDELPRTQVDGSFTRSTVEMIALKAEEDLLAVQAAAPRQKRRVWLIAAALMSLAAVAGFIAVVMVGHRADEQMLRDLPVVENLDQYRAVEDVEFLRMLQSRDFHPQEARHDG